jgi:hypothetical protein
MIKQTIWEILDHEKLEIPALGRILDALSAVAEEDVQLARKMALKIIEAYRSHARKERS